METMRRFRSPWLLALPLMAAGSLAAHVASYRLAIPNAHTRARDLQDSGHAYLEQLPLLTALIGAPALVGLGFAIFGVANGRGRPRLAAWPFALLPPLCFGMQEHFERFMHSGAFPWDAGLERTFLLGLLLQGPFALGAFLLARGMLVGIDAVRHVFARRPARSLSRQPRCAFPQPQVSLLRPAVLALGHAERGPPAPIRL